MCVQEHPDGIVVKVKVQPRSSKNKFSGVLGDCLKVNLTAPPVDGEANSALVKFLAETAKVSRSNIDIVSGHTGRTKLIKLRGITKDKFSELIRQT